MKNLLILAGFFASSLCAMAHTQAPPDLSTIATSDTVYVVHVASVGGGTANRDEPLTTVAITEVLRGKSASQLVLSAYPDSGLKPNTDWIIYRIPFGFKNCVGWAMKGDCEWIPISTDPANHNSISRYRFSVDQVRDYLRSHPAKT